MKNVLLTLKDSAGKHKLLIGKKKLDKYIELVPDAQGKSYEDAVIFILSKYFMTVEREIDWNGLSYNMETMGIEDVSEMVSYLILKDIMEHLPCCGNCSQFLKNNGGIGLGFCAHTYGALSVFTVRGCSDMEPKKN